MDRRKINQQQPKELFPGPRRRGVLNQDGGRSKYITPPPSITSDQGSQNSSTAGDPGSETPDHKDRRRGAAPFQAYQQSVTSGGSTSSVKSNQDDDRSRQALNHSSKTLHCVDQQSPPVLTPRPSAGSGECAGRAYEKPQSECQRQKLMEERDAARAEAQELSKRLEIQECANERLVSGWLDDLHTTLGCNCGPQIQQLLELREAHRQLRDEHRELQGAFEVLHREYDAAKHQLKMRDATDLGNDLRAEVRAVALRHVQPEAQRTAGTASCPARIENPSKLDISEPAAVLVQKANKLKRKVTDEGQEGADRAREELNRLREDRCKRLKREQVRTLGKPSNPAGPGQDRRRHEGGERPASSTYRFPEAYREPEANRKKRAARNGTMYSPYPRRTR